MTVLQRIRELEQSIGVLGAVKLGNACLILIWGFGLTFVFARALDNIEFQNFVLLIALSNFTISAEFGFTNIIYNRLRRWRLHAGGQFSFTEISAVLAAIITLIVLAVCALALCFVVGIIVTQLPLLFLSFFIVSCLNIAVLLCKRVLAALDRNLLFEFTDICRRVVSLVVLFAVLLGLDLGFSVLILLVVTLASLGIWCVIIHRVLKLRMAHWTSIAKGIGIIRTRYLRDIRASILFTLADVGANNMPFLVIAFLTDDLRPLLLYDFAYKLMRVMGIVMRAIIESYLPRITAALHSGSILLVRRAFLHCLAGGVIPGLGVSLLLLCWGHQLAQFLYHGKMDVTVLDLTLLSLVMLALPVNALSIYVNCAIGRFGTLLKASMPYLIGATFSAPIAMVATWGHDAWAETFLSIFTIVYLLAMLLHLWLLKSLVTGEWEQTI
ncbi:hypothetical protein [Rhizorhapis sp. SPR117]|uniref:hypothetical protein n=1 Tax=Rhizorhapis sp. SPR117 TaxID=2912611 RepID=UPI001F2B45F1|nr:hypothetical protein [Rhizorhapis sp. SPR117]